MPWGAILSVKIFYVSNTMPHAAPIGKGGWPESTKKGIFQVIA
ncbi:hypothetical protein DESPIG_00590 [Desulfovibrio piger ATCC 29098]|uniref:Uncharacterized protein n=1 Tax=Desulfovibrio piger ATCC 29098 TaxID=411464 RepID=B6WRA2_9BACT|nr:hypothetical protein DESPIG_00590 [Desulfovibrio piger ATCC 29098]